MKGPQSSGFESTTRDPERRDFFDLRRRITALESVHAGGTGSADIDGGDPSSSGSGFIDGGSA
jgi:hypothetical protein